MKKRLVAVMLGLTLSLVTVGEAGAAAFSSPDSETVHAEITETENADVFSAGDGDEQDAQTDDADHIQDEFSSDAEDELSTGTAGTVVTDGSLETGAAVVVQAEDWVQENGHFKLRKTVTAPAAEEENQVSAEFGTDAAEEVSTQPEAEDETASPEIVEEASVQPDASEAEVQQNELPSESFYTAADGLVEISTEYKGELHTGCYLFDENGYMVTGQAEVNPETAAVTTEVEEAEGSAEAVVGAAEATEDTVQYYFTTVEEAVAYPGCENEAVTPYASTVGQQKKATWQWDGSVFCYFDANGVQETIAQLEKKQKEAGTYTGYFKINGEYYCLDENGKPRTGDITLTVNGVSNQYYFEENSTIPGRMFHEGWRQVIDSKGERWLYYSMGADIKDIGKYYKRGITATKLDKNIKGDSTYLLDANGYILKSTMKKAANGACYATDKNGVIYRDTLVRYNNYRYYFAANGKRVSWKNRWNRVGNHYYYFGKTPGRVEEKHGWQKITRTNGKYVGWFYFDSKGNHYTDKLTSAGLYFTPSGKLASGLTKMNGKMYLFEVSNAQVHKGTMYKNTMVRYKNNWYIASSTGGLYTDRWKKYNGSWYYLKNYKVQTNQFMKKNGVNGYLDATGKYTTGWVIVSNAQNLVKYIDPNGNGFAKNTSLRVNGVLYYFDKNGYRISDVTSMYRRSSYFLEVDRVNGVMTVYTDSSKTIPIKTIRVSVGLPGTPTWTGTYRLSRSAVWQPLMGPSWGQYGTHVDGCGQGGIFIHSIACGQPNRYNLPVGEYLKLGQPASHGCIRACVADAKWVYENCNGSVIHIMDGQYKADDVFKGPLGKKPITPLRGAGNFDPTDPAA